jgi:type VI secretion system secreted protein VgrG
MALLSSTLKGRVLRFNSEAESIGRNALQIIDVNGREAVSDLYRFDMTLMSTDPNIDSAELLSNPAYIGIKQGVDLSGGDRGIRTLRIHGILAYFAQREKGMDSVIYRAALVPRLWRLKLSNHTRIFMGKTVPEIVEEVLKEYDFVDDEDYSFKTNGREYPTQDYVVQKENDWDFINRLCEHNGIFYFFQQGDDCEKVIFADSMGAYEPVLGSSTLPYRPIEMGERAAGSGEGDWFGSEFVHGLEYRHNLVSADVVMKDYNHRTPSVSLEASASVGSDVGTGTVYDFGSHYKDEGEGNDLAGIRAQEIKCREQIFTGKGYGRNFMAGATYTLEEHYREDFNQEYFLVEVRHRMSQAISLTAISHPIASYENEFVSIPASEVFRPRRVTPKPVISGTINGIVDAGGSGDYAELNEYGEYKVILPFDQSGEGGGKASRFVRMAQPYSGAGMGMHFPLHAGTEVIICHTNGDPDRPYIAGSIPNAETLGPVSGENQTQCKIATGG